MFGDILSDECAMITGSMGHVPSRQPERARFWTV
ncbi:isocitrate/isopropylmalate family dehydrogenase [Escherichia coli]